MPPTKCDDDPRGPAGPSRPGLRNALGALILVLTCAAGPALAQPGGPGGPGEEIRADELRETIEIYMLSRMKIELELTAAQEQEVVPLVQELSAARQAHRQERRLSLLRLRPLVEDPATDDAAITAELERMRQGERSFREAEEAAMARIREVLTPRQEGRFALFLERFMQDMQRRLRQMRRLHEEEAPLAGEGRRRHGGGPADPEGP